jgi:hypothetical protein
MKLAQGSCPMAGSGISGVERINLYDDLRNAFYKNKRWISGLCLTFSFGISSVKTLGFATRE